MSAWIALAVFLIIGATLCWAVAFILASEGRALSGLFVVAFSGGVLGIVAVTLLSLGLS